MPAALVAAIVAGVVALVVAVITNFVQMRIARDNRRAEAEAEEQRHHLELENRRAAAAEGLLLASEALRNRCWEGAALARALHDESVVTGSPSLASWESEFQVTIRRWLDCWAPAPSSPNAWLAAAVEQSRFRCMDCIDVAIARIVLRTARGGKDQLLALGEDLDRLNRSLNEFVELSRRC